MHIQPQVLEVAQGTPAGVAAEHFLGVTLCCVGAAGTVTVYQASSATGRVLAKCAGAINSTNDSATPGPVSLDLTDVAGSEKGQLWVVVTGTAATAYLHYSK